MLIYKCSLNKRTNGDFCSFDRWEGMFLPTWVEITKQTKQSFKDYLVAALSWYHMIAIQLTASPSWFPDNLLGRLIGLLLWGFPYSPASYPKIAKLSWFPLAHFCLPPATFASTSHHVQNCETGLCASSPNPTNNFRNALSTCLDIEELGHDSGPQFWREVVVTNQNTAFSRVDGSWYLTHVENAPLWPCQLCCHHFEGI